MDANLIIISQASFEKEIFVNASNGYAVLGFGTDEEIMASAVAAAKHKSRNKYAFVAVCNGNYTGFDKRATYKLFGKWEKNSKYGYQFFVHNWEIVVENSRAGIIAYLTTIDGIGPKTAERIYKKFGNETLNILDNNIDELSKIRGISSKKLTQIKTYLNNNKEFKEITSFFSEFAFPIPKVRRIYEVFKNKTLAVVKDNPFKLCTVSGIDFNDANEIAIEANIALKSNLRIHYAIYYVFKTIAAAKGHLYIPKKELIDITEKLLNKNSPEVVDRNQIEAVYHGMVLDGLLVEEITSDTCVYLRKSFVCEKQTAARLVDFLHAPNVFKIPAEKLKEDMVEAQKEFGIILNNTQIKAIQTSINNNISIITGGPGTGKTTILKVILYVFRKNFGDNIRLCAPTGRAARRMAESTGELSASTIHNLLGIGEDYEWAPDNQNILPVNADLLVVDEVSMVDMELMHALIEATPFSCKVILIGDADQLPSVGAGNVLREMIRSKTIPTTVLDKIYRQDGLSKIVINSHKIKKGDLSFEYDTDFNFYETDDINCVESTVIELFLKELRKDGANLDNVQILTPFKDPKKPASTFVFNTVLQEAVNPKSESKNEIKIGKTVFRTGDKVIQQKNSPDIKNGDIGYITKIQPDENGEIIVTIDFGDGRIMCYSRFDMEENNINLAYAITIHKSQGSEYKSVIIPMIAEHQFFLWRNLIYTAWTRAKETVLMVGSDSALIYGAQRCDVDKRNTLLAARMKGREKQYKCKKAQKGKQVQLKELA